MSQKEIDLIELFNKFIKFVIKNFWFLLIFCIIGIAAGYTYSKIKKTEFISTGIFSTWIEEDLLVQLMDIMQKQIESNNHANMSKRYDLPYDEVKNITTIDYSIPESKLRPTQDPKSIGYLEKRIFVSVEVYSNDKESLLHIEDYFNKYFDNNINLHKRAQQRKNILEILEKEIDYEIDTHKSRNSSFNDKSHQKSSILLVNYNVKDLLDLAKLKYDIEFEIENENIIRIEQNFTRPVEIKGSASKIILLSFAMFFIIGLIVKYFINIRKTA